MSISITDNHLATITNKCQDKKVTISRYYRSPIEQDKFLVKILEQAIILNIDPYFTLDYSTFVIAEYTVKLTGNKLLIVNIEKPLVIYDGFSLLNIAPKTYGFTHDNDDYVIELFDNHFTLSKSGSSQVFSSLTGEIN